MNLNPQCVREAQEAPMEVFFEGFEREKTQTKMQGGGPMFKSVHAIVMLSLRCFERLFGDEGNCSELEKNRAVRDDPYLESLLKLMPR
jgi:hypothetical protein